MIKQRSTSQHKSQGAVLLVSLVLLTAMTIIGVASIDSATLQSQMARNSLYAQNLYQKSLSEIQAQYLKLQGSDYLTKVLTSTINVAVNSGSYPGQFIDDGQTETHYSTDAYKQTVSIVYTGDGAPPSGYSVGIFIGKNFEIDSNAKVEGTGSASNQTQGLNYPAPLNY